MSSTRNHPLDEIFHPESIAVVGASATEQERGWVARLLNFGYSGHLYPVNPRASEINGLKAYPTVKDIPGPVDYVIFNIPAHLTPQIMEECVAKRVKTVHIYTAGYGETGKEEGKELAARVAAIARAGGVRVLGPNCMGLYYPREGLTFSTVFSRESGTVAFVSQTGAGAERFIPLANNRGIHFSKVISYGNAMDLDSPDFLEYLAGDEETEIIGCYIEGVKDGRRFLEAVKTCLRTKPVIILKGGLTESGAGAAASHTASLTGSKSIWDAFFRQTGAIPVDTLEEIIDVVVALQHLPRLKGRRVGLMGRGGGLGVIATDTCERAGLKVPPFLPETTKKLEEIVPAAGSGVRNPVEGPNVISGLADFYAKGLKIVAADPQIDVIIIRLAIDVYGRHDTRMLKQLGGAAEAIGNTTRTLDKPVAVVVSRGEDLETIASVLEFSEKLVMAGMPVYSEFEAAANSINKLIGYNEFLEKGQRGS